MRPVPRRPIVAAVAVGIVLVLTAVVLAPGAGGPPSAGHVAEPGASPSASAQFAASPPPPGSVVSADVVVYGATPSGILAAVSAARLGASVILATSDAQVGGMMASGLGHADVGRPALIGGITRGVFERLARAESRAGFLPTAGWSYEPHVALDVFNRLLRQAHVSVYLGLHLDRSVPLVIEGDRIVDVAMTNGTRIRGTVYIDASYEGDLMAAAGVPWTIGREAKSANDESLAGVHVNGTHLPPAALVSGVDVAGNPLPGIDAGPVQQGAADGNVQAATYRLCVTASPANRLPFARPDGYDPSAYAVVGRAVENRVDLAGMPLRLASFLSFERLPGRKADLNSSGLFSTDLAGGAAGWTAADDAGRLAIAATHRAWVAGFLWYLQTDPAVPARLRAQISRWGLCADEFAATGGWPPELYVREARRMVGSVVLTQADLERPGPRSDAIALGTYRIDAHYVRRVLGPRGIVRGDGQLTAQTQPYPIPYASIVPPAGSVDNLIVAVTISASHVAWSSIRTEPTLMEIGEAAGAAAALAIRSGDGVREVSTDAIRAVLVARGGILAALPDGSAAPSGAAPSGSAQGAAFDASSLVSIRTWSVVQTESQPSRSAAAAAASIASGEARVVKFGRHSP